MKDVVDDVRRWMDAGSRVAVATVVGVKRSAPRPPGAKMAVERRRRGVGRRVRRAASRARWSRPPRQVLAGDGPQLLHFGIADSEAWDVGLPCGGEIDVFVEEYRE